MKRIIQYAAIVIALSLAASCSNLIEEKALEGGLISFEAQSVETKAMVTPDNLTNEKFAVWDLLDGNTHIQNAIQYSGGKWGYVTPATYYWKDGTHKFFGYTYNIGSFAGNTWSIGQTAITTTSNQTDLLYSSIYTTTAADWKTTEGHTKDTSVKLTFHHLLSAIRFTMVNASGENVTVSSAAVSLPNTGSATVSFVGSAAAPDVTVNSTAAAFGGFTAQKTLSDGQSLNVLDGTILNDADTPAAPLMIWPQTLSENAVTMTVTLTVGNGAIRTVNVPVPAGTVWEAGKINSYKILIYPNDIKLVFEVQPWEVVEIPEMGTSTSSINMSNVSWVNTKVKMTQDGDDMDTVNNGEYSVTLYYQPYVNGTKYTDGNGYYPAQGFFTVNYPLKGKFKIGLIPAYGQTEVNPAMYEIWIYDYESKAFRLIGAEEDLADWREYEGTVLKGANTIYFQVRASSTVAATHPEYKAQIDIWFKPEEGSEWISAYSEIRANYAIVIPAR